MACIIGLLDMLLMENLTVEQEGSIRQIHRCATSLVSLLNSALDIAKVCLSYFVLAPFFLAVSGLQLKNADVDVEATIFSSIYRGLGNAGTRGEGSIGLIRWKGFSCADIAIVFCGQVESGKLVLEKAEFDLEAELTALIDVFSVQCDNKSLFISLDVAG